MNLKQCRICLEGGNNLITVCDCIGSVQFVHQKCIQTWISTTTNPESKKKCELCNAKYNFSPADTYICGEYYTIVIPGNFLIAFLFAAPLHYVTPHFFVYRLGHMHNFCDTHSRNNLLSRRHFLLQITRV